MKSTRLIILLLFALAFLKMPTVQAFEVNYNIMPGSGSSTQPILIWVRANPLIDTQQMTVRVFWDGNPIGDPRPDIRIGKTATYKHAWDITVIPPVDYNYLGKHKIQVWIETGTGELEIRTWQYTIDDGMPPVDWWDKLPQELINEIRGPAGQKGNTGAQGQRGERGATGTKGKNGATGDQGIIGDTGAQGITGATGAQGEQGIPGESPNFMLTLIVACVLTVIVTVGASFYLFKRKEA